MEEMELLKKNANLEKSSQLLNLRPFVDSSGLLRVGGRQQHAELSYSKKHPIILHHKHPLTHLLVRSEYLYYMLIRLYSWRLSTIITTLWAVESWCGPSLTDVSHVINSP